MKRSGKIYKTPYFAIVDGMIFNKSHIDGKIPPFLIKYKLLVKNTKLSGISKDLCVLIKQRIVEANQWKTFYGITNLPSTPEGYLSMYSVIKCKDVPDNEHFVKIYNVYNKSLLLDKIKKYLILM